MVLMMTGGRNMWFWFALGSAVFAALTSILAKVGIEGVNPTGLNCLFNFDYYK